MLWEYKKKSSSNSIYGRVEMKDEFLVGIKVIKNSSLDWSTCRPSLIPH